MPNKDFEEQIRDGLRDWAIEPSDATRAKVLEAVRRKDRRRVFLWIPLVLLLLGLGTWGALQMFRHTTGYDAVSQQPGIVAKNAVHSAQDTGASTTSNQGTGKNLAGAVRPPLPGKDKESIAGNRDTETGSGRIGAGKNSLIPGILDDRRKAKSSSRVWNSKPLYPDRAMVPLSGWAWMNSSPLQAGPRQYLRPQDYITASLRDPGGSGPQKRQSRAIQKWPNSGKWALRGYLGGGIAGQGRFGQFHYAGGTVPTPSAPAAYVGIPAGRQNLDTLASVKPGAGLQVGIQGLFRISRHIQWSAGLEYDHWQMTISPVRENAPLLPGVYASNFFAASRGSAGQTFTNRYDLLQLPLDLDWSISPEKAWNPSLFTGFSLGYIFPHGNLMYNSEGNGYVSSGTLARRWSLVWEAGAHLDILTVGHYVLGGGPVFQYGLLTTQKHPPVPDHLNYLGLRLSLTRPVLKH